MVLGSDERVGYELEPADEELSFEPPVSDDVELEPESDELELDDVELDLERLSFL